MTTQLRTRQIADANITLAKLASDVRLDTITAPTGPVGMNSQKITSLLDPTSDQDAATKVYVDTGLAGKIGTSLTDGNIIVGNGSNVAAAVAMSGEATIANTGAVTLANSAVIGKVLTGFTSGAGTVAATDTILEAIEKLDGNVNALESAVILKGTWDASAGTFPGSGAAQAGWSYIVSVAGTVDSVSFAVNDRIVAITDNASTTTYASNWFKLDYTDQVLSVNGQTGAVSLDAGDIAAVTDKNYVTDAQLVVIGNTSGTNTGDQVAGDGLSGTSTLSVNVDDSSIEINTDALRVKALGIATGMIADDAVTLDKIANASANSKLLGSGATGSGASYAEITLGTGLSMSGTTLNASSAVSFADSEVPTGSINGSNVTFTLANTPTAGSVHLYLNGVRITVADGDFTISGDTITMTTAPLTGESLVADYRY